MNHIASMLAAGLLVGVPLAAHAQDHDSRSDWRGGHARAATAYGHDAAARRHDGHDRRADGVRYGHVGVGDRFDSRGFDSRRFDGDRFDSDRGFDRRGFSGGVTLGFGYGGDYPYGGGYYDGGYDDGGGYAYGDAYRPGDYGADYAYSYPDQYGTYQPFAYDYSDRDDAYYADGEPSYGDGDYQGYQAAPNDGWSRGGAPVDCGQWIWREGRGAYEWVARPC